MDCIWIVFQWIEMPKKMQRQAGGIFAKCKSDFIPTICTNNAKNLIQNEMNTI